MLSDRERETLREVQHPFVTDDPRFAASSSLGRSRLHLAYYVTLDGTKRSS
jgi:hypothetical protein